MTLDDARVAVGRVAVGPTRQAAAAVFGRHDDDLVLTSYADFGRDVDLASVSALDLLVGSGGADVLQTACDRAAAGLCAVRLGVRPRAAGSLGALLDREDVSVVGVENVDGTAVLSIAPSTAEGSAPVALVLAALDAGGAPAAGPDAPTARRGGSPPPALRRRPVPTLVTTLAQVQRWRDGQRRRATLVAILVVVVLALVLIGVLPHTDQALVSIGVPLLVLLLVGATAVSTYVTLLLARQVDRQNARLERLLKANRQVVQNRATALAKRLDALERSQSRLPFVEQYVEAVAEHGASTSARLGEVLDRLDLDQTVDRSRPSQ